MGDVGQSHLPIRRPTVSGVVNRTQDGSQPDWNLSGHPTPPEAAPNVLLVLIDDAGFGNPSTFGRPSYGSIYSPNLTRFDGDIAFDVFHPQHSGAFDGLLAFSKKSHGPFLEVLCVFRPFRKTRADALAL